MKAKGQSQEYFELNSNNKNPDNQKSIIETPAVLFTDNQIKLKTKI
jgi:hypothetical protein